MQSEEWWSYSRERENSVVCDYFTGQLLSKVTCSHCRSTSIAFDDTWDFALNFAHNDGGDLLSMLENFLKEETIASDYYCSRCKGTPPLLSLPRVQEEARLLPPAQRARPADQALLLRQVQQAEAHQPP